MDSEARRKKQRELMAELLERKIRLHARELYEKRGKTEGHALQDWFEAEAKVLGKSTMAPFYRKVRTQAEVSAKPAESQGCEAGQ